MVEVSDRDKLEKFFKDKGIWFDYMDDNKTRLRIMYQFGISILGSVAIVRFKESGEWDRGRL